MGDFRHVTVDALPGHHTVVVESDGRGGLLARWEHNCCGAPRRGPWRPVLLDRDGSLSLLWEDLQ